MIQKFYRGTRLTLLLFIGITSGLPKLGLAETINKLVLTGNTKTQEAALLRWGGIILGQEISQAELQEIIERLQRAYQFTLKSIHFDQSTLYVAIQDKWSTFPVPMITQSGDYYSRGILLYENNFLGRLGTLAPGIFQTNSGFNALFYWQEDGILAQNFGMKVLLLYKSDLTEFQRNSNVTHSFETRQNTIILTPNYNKGRNDHKLGPIFTKKKIYNNAQQVIFERTDFGPYYRHQYNNYKKLPVLFDGIKTTFDLFLLPNKKGKISVQTGGEAKYVLPYQKHSLLLQLAANYTNEKGYDTPKMLGGNEGNRGYDRESLPVQHNIGGLIQPQIQLWNKIYSAYFYEFNYLKTILPVNNGAKLYESTIGFNFAYFFEKITIPALIIEYARNLDDSSNHFHLNIGLKI